MGVTGLKRLINAQCVEFVRSDEQNEDATPAFETVSLSVFSGYKVGVDTSTYLYKYKCNGNSLYRSISKQVKTLRSNGIIPLYVFDGIPPTDKIDTIQERTERRVSSQTNYNTILEEQKMIYGDNLSEDELLKLSITLREAKRRIQVRPTKTDIANVKEMLTLLGVRWMNAVTESDILLSQLFKSGTINAIMSDDYDTLPFGCEVYLRDYSHDGTVTLYRLPVILKMLKLTYNQFVDLCILAGCDYCKTIKKMAIVRAYSNLLKYGNIETIIQNTDPDNIPLSFNYVSARNIFINAMDSNTAVEECTALLNTPLQFNETAYNEFMNHNTVVRKSTESNIAKLSKSRNSVKTET
jgi:flap endonuclease-1